MFGYVVVHKPELKFKEFDEYRGFYCGLCKSLKENYGPLGQIILNYDLTFLGILLTALYEKETIKKEEFCIVHPFHKQMKYSNECLDYCSDMTIILSYFKCEDDWLDDKKILSKCEMSLLQHKFNQLKKKYPEKIETIQNVLRKTHELEKEDCKDIDALANLSGQMLACIYEYQDDVWKTTLSKMGYFLGKFIYIMDAYEDLDLDIKKNNFNVLKDKEININEILEMMMAECTSYFERLPILDNADLLRNILYAGIWTKLNLLMKKKGEKHESV